MLLGDVLPEAWMSWGDVGQGSQVSGGAYGGLPEAHSTFVFLQALRLLVKDPQPVLPTQTAAAGTPVELSFRLQTDGPQGGPWTKGRCLGNKRTSQGQSSTAV